MIKITTIFILLSFSTFSHALSVDCSYSKDPDFQKHSDKLIIEYWQDENTLDVWFSVPKEIKGLPFEVISISHKDGEFFTYLRTEVVENEIKSFFHAKKSFFNYLSVLVAYKDGPCSQTFHAILKKHNKFKNENAASGSDASTTRPF